MCEIEVIGQANATGIIEQAFGAFLGFIFAFLGAWLTAIAVKRIKMFRLRKRVYLELAEVYCEIISPINKNTLLYYYFPVWDSVISSALLLDIGDNTFIQSLVGIYGRLKIQNELEMRMLLENEEQDPTHEIVIKRENLAKIIQKSEHFRHIQKVVDKLNKKVKNIKTL